MTADATGRARLIQLFQQAGLAVRRTPMQPVAEIVAPFVAEALASEAPTGDPIDLMAVLKSSLAETERWARAIHDAMTGCPDLWENAADKDVWRKTALEVVAALRGGSEAGTREPDLIAQLKNPPIELVKRLIVFALDMNGEDDPHVQQQVRDILSRFAELAVASRAVPREPEPFATSNQPLTPHGEQVALEAAREMDRREARTPNTGQLLATVDTAYDIIGELLAVLRVPREPEPPDDRDVLADWCDQQARLATYSDEADHFKMIAARLRVPREATPTPPSDKQIEDALNAAMRDGEFDGMGTAALAAHLGKSLRRVAPAPDRETP